jgi:tetratricopeptide (TPR) repeat protein
VPDRARGEAHFALAWADSERRFDPRGPRHHAREAQAAMERAATSDAELAFARVAVATVSVFQGADEEAERVLDEFMEEVERAGGWPAAITRLLRGFARARAGNLAALRQDGEVSLERFRQLGDRWGMVQSLELLSSVELVHGRYQQAAAQLWEGLRCAWELRMAPEVGVQLCRLAHVAVLQGDLELAEARLVQALAAAQELGLATEAAFARAGLALVAQRRGDTERAGREREQALALLQRRSLPHPLVHVLLSWLGTVAEQQGDLESATALHRGVLEQATMHGGPMHGNPALVALALSGLAGVACAEGDPEQAVVLLGAGAALLRSMGMPLLTLPRGERVDLDRIARAARRALGEERFAQAFARGEALSPKEAVALAESR